MLTGLNTVISRKYTTKIRKPTDSLERANLVKENSMSVKGTCKSGTQGKEGGMVRITNLFTTIQTGRKSRNSIGINYLGSRDYVVLRGLQCSEVRYAGSILKYRRRLTHLFDANYKNSGYSEMRKHREYGGFVVRNVSTLRKEPSKLVLDKDILSGIYKSEEIDKLKEQLEERAEERSTGLTAIISDPLFLISCWCRIRSNKGSLTPALTEETLDGIKLRWFTETAEKLGNGLYEFQASRIKNIPKTSGRMRSLSIPNPRDKILQEAIRFILEMIFESTFKDSSHGFRPRKGCHTVINEIRMTFGYVNWFIEGDISNCFNETDQNILMNRIKSRINDQSFIDLIYKILRQGEGYKNSTIQIHKRGVPQGGIISPILSNIFLDIFDEKIIEMQKAFNRGIRRKANPVYTLMTRTGKVDHNRNIKPRIGNDPDFKRMRYVRYADDFLIGIIGSKEDCKRIKQEISTFLEKQMKLRLNDEKTKITHATTSRAKFLGYEIHQTPIDKQPIRYLDRQHGDKRRTRITPRILTDAPIDEVISKLKERGFIKGKNPSRCGRAVYLPLTEMIRYYRRIEDGILNYYVFASNYGRLAARVHYIMKYSCALTIASKLRLKTLKGTFNKFGKDLTIRSETGKVVINYPTAKYKKPNPKKK